MNRFARLFTTAFLATTLSAGLFACSVTTTDPTPAANKSSSSGNPNGTKTGSSTKSKPKTQPKPAALKSLAKSTPPEGAQSEGTMSSPVVGGSEIPIVEVEVYLVTIDFDEDGTDDTVHWAHTEDGMTYFWSEGPVTCADGLSDGTGGFVAAIAADGSGAYLFALDECPEQNLFGCDFDSNGVETACGACAWNDEVIACVADE
jgi:hypothetical protein